MRRTIPVLLAVAMLGVAAPAASAKSSAKPKCVVPMLTGDTLSHAKTKLKEAHCTLGKVKEPKDAKGKTLIVSAQSPKAGKREKNKTRVSVTLKAKTPLIATQMYDSVAVLPNYEAQTPGDASYLEVATILFYSTSTEPLLYLVGQPITYTIFDEDTDQTLATFAGTTDTLSTGCAIGESTNYPADTTDVLTGKSITPYEGATPVPGCDLATLTIPSADTVVLQARFAGNSIYASSAANPAAVL